MVGRNPVEDSPSAASFSSNTTEMTGGTSATAGAVPHLNSHHLSQATSSGGRSGSVGGNSSPMRSLSSSSGGLYISAPGKIILFGEHAVVYGRTAIAGSIDLRTYVSLFTSADGQIYLCLPDLDVKKTWMLKDLQRACDRLAAEYPLEEGPPSLEVIVPIARRLSGACEDQCGVQHLAILAFWYLLIGVVLRKRAMDAGVHFDVAPSDEQEGGAVEVEVPNPPAWRPFLSASPTRQMTAMGSQTSLNSAPPSPAPSTGSSHSASPSIDLLAVKVTVRFKLPACVGLGSSGAFCVCIASALLQTAGIIPPPSIANEEDGSLTWEEAHLETIRKWSAAAESLIHGRASGLDAAVCTYGGVASYKPGKRIENLQNIPDLKVILVNSKVERSTSRMVQNVKERLRKFPKIIDSIFDSIDAISLEAARILQRSPLAIDENGSGVLENGGRSGTLTPSYGADSNAADHHNLQPVHVGGRCSSLSSYVAGGKRGSTASAASGMSGDFRGLSKLERNELTETFDKLNDLSRINNQLLIALGVGHAKVDQICTLLGRYGIHPKMTGAGGGGSVFAFLKPDISQTLLNMIREELRKDGYDMWQPSLGGPGVLCHPHKPDIFSAAANAAPPSSATTITTTLPSASSLGGGGGGSSTSRSITPASSHQSTPSSRHKK